MTAYDLTTFGEAQIRLTVPRGDRLATCRDLRLTPAGSEANVAGLLAQLGRRTAFASVIPHGDLGQRFIEEYRGVGVDLRHCVACEGRMALYFMSPAIRPCRRRSCTTASTQNSARSRPRRSTGTRSSTRGFCS